MPVVQDRRWFLRVVGAGAAAAATFVLDSCSGGGSGTPDLVLIPNDWDFFAGVDYRLSVLLASNAHNGAPVTLDSPVTLRVGPQSGPLGPPIPTVIHVAGNQPNYALATYRFDKPGVYTLEATFKGRSTSLPISVTSASQSDIPFVGDKLISVPTPTTTAPLGVNPVCTAQPACPFHQVSLDAAIRDHQAVALLFATPALCTSRFCGPVLANLQAVSQPWANRVTFIHCEIYTDLTGATSTKPVTAYHLQHEPMLYLAGPDSVIRVKIDNLFDQTEARSALMAAFGRPV